MTSRANLTTASVLTPDLIDQAATALKAQNADAIGESYVAIVHPYVAYDLRRNPEWIDVHKYSTPENIYNGEIGKLAGVRFIETSEAKIWTGTGCPTSLAVFGTLVLAAHAYAVTEVEGGGLQHIVKQLGEGEDPLNQRASVAGRPSRPQSGCVSSTWCASRASARSTARRRRRTNTPLMALPLGELDTKCLRGQGC